jgi:uncharacterized membrane protein YeaQ/YmgE (transglycosylase-associated protein family)
MNPSYGILMWIVIGALAGWIGSMVMGTNARQGGVMNVVVGVIGAVLGGFLARTVFGDAAGNNGFFASFGVALLGSCVLLFIVKMATGGRPLTH